MPYVLEFEPEALKALTKLAHDPSLAIPKKAVAKALLNLAANPGHQSLNTHKLKNYPCPHDRDTFEAHAQNIRPGVADPLLLLAERESARDGVQGEEG